MTPKLSPGQAARNEYNRLIDAEGSFSSMWELVAAAAIAAQHEMTREWWPFFIEGAAEAYDDATTDVQRAAAFSNLYTLAGEIGDALLAARDELHDAALWVDALAGVGLWTLEPLVGGPGPAVPALQYYTALGDAGLRERVEWTEASPRPFDAAKYRAALDTVLSRDIERLRHALRETTSLLSWHHEAGAMIAAKPGGDCPVCVKHGGTGVMETNAKVLGEPGHLPAKP